MTRSLTHAAAFVAAAITAGTAVVACDRPASRLAAPSPERYSRDAGAAEAPRAAIEEAPVAAPAPEPAGPLVDPAALTDTVITGRIKSAILSDPAMAGADVSVNTDRGVVVLAGTVKSQEQTGIASAHAQRQDGVMRVDNLLSPELS